MHTLRLRRQPRGLDFENTTKEQQHRKAILEKKRRLNDVRDCIDFSRDFLISRTYFFLNLLRRTHLGYMTFIYFKLLFDTFLWCPTGPHVGMQLNGTNVSMLRVNKCGPKHSTERVFQDKNFKIISIN